MEQTAGTVYSTKSILYGCKGSRLSHGGPDAVNKVLQPIRGLKRMEESGREGTKNEFTKILLQS